MERVRKHRVHLDEAQRQRLDETARNGRGAAKLITHARILLMADEAHRDGRYRDEQIAAALGVHLNAVKRVRRTFVARGLEPALHRAPRPAPAAPPKIDGRAEAHLVASCCSPPPEGRARWTLALLADGLKAGGFVTSVCRETVRRAPKKTS